MISEPVIISVDEIDDRFSEIIDVRSPSEYEDDHLEGAVNLPVLSDEERTEIGTTYKQTSTFLARREGAAYIAEHAASYLRNHFADRDAGYFPLLYCWRGGMRSQSLATILSSVGWRVGVLDGGYRAHRREVVKWLTEAFPCIGFQFVVLAGLTGSGKTRILRTMAERGEQVLDLEGLANHRGSLLGDEPGSPQPSQKRFENLLRQRLHEFDPSKPIFVESESHRIGTCQIPARVWDAIKTGTVIELSIDLEARTWFLLDSYDHFSEQPEKLTEKLGQLRQLHPAGRIDHWNALIDAGSWAELVRALLVDHYDPAYRKSRKKLFAGAREIIEGGDLNPASIAEFAGRVSAAGNRIESSSLPTV